MDITKVKQFGYLLIVGVLVGVNKVVSMYK